MTASVIWNGGAEAFELEPPGAEAIDVTTTGRVAVHTQLDATVQSPLGLIFKANPHLRDVIGLYRREDSRSINDLAGSNRNRPVDKRRARNRGGRADKADHPEGTDDRRTHAERHG